jgi:hypothetical protein
MRHSCEEGVNFDGIREEATTSSRSRVRTMLSRARQQAVFGTLRNLRSWFIRLFDNRSKLFKAGSRL